MSLLAALSRLSLREPTYTATRCICSSNAALIHSSLVLYAEPLKKKKKLDPQVIKQREERKRKRLEKQIRRLEKNARQLKPIQELEVPTELIDEKDKRARNVVVTAEEMERRVKLNKEWALYKHKQNLADFQIIDRVVQSQRKALEELRKESEELYREAIQLDVTLLPITLNGPVATPPIEGYDSPDGEYITKVNRWE